MEAGAALPSSFPYWSKGRSKWLPTAHTRPPKIHGEHVHLLPDIRLGGARPSSVPRRGRQEARILSSNLAQAGGEGAKGSTKGLLASDWRQYNLTVGG